ncbi:hypothetical protein lerEdw1_004494 [Lerista edwardsae]|nr:hypothetical protein lerEdw1_004494 [Lerista edwardsae]
MWRGGVARGLLALGLGAALEALACWLLRRGRRARPVREVLFFPSRVTCVEGLLAERAGALPAWAPCACPLPHCESALSRLVGRLLAARRSLELCLFAFSSPQLGRVVLMLHGRGVRVRVVTDTDYMVLAGSQIGRLRKAGSSFCILGALCSVGVGGFGKVKTGFVALNGLVFVGIQVRHDQDKGYMHHKFAIVDKKVLITGSLNWTTQAIQSNRENVLVMEDAACVNIFLAEFEKLWDNYNPTNYTFFPKEEKQVPQKNKTSLGLEKQLSK